MINTAPNLRRVVKFVLKKLNPYFTASEIEKDLPAGALCTVGAVLGTLLSAELSIKRSISKREFDVNPN